MREWQVIIKSSNCHQRLRNPIVLLFKKYLFCACSDFVFCPVVPPNGCSLSQSQVSGNYCTTLTDVSTEAETNKPGSAQEEISFERRRRQKVEKNMRSDTPVVTHSHQAFCTMICFPQCMFSALPG